MAQEVRNSPIPPQTPIIIKPPEILAFKERNALLFIGSKYSDILLSNEKELKRLFFEHYKCSLSQALHR